VVLDFDWLRTMKILLVNTMHKRGGAAIAALRLMDALVGQGVDVRLLLLEQKGGDSRIAPNARFLARHYTISKMIERLPALRYSRRWSNARSLEFSPAVLSADSSDAVNRAQADVVNLHWVNHGHLSPEGIGRIERPVVWTAHDMWPFTGGCHYSGDCERYRAACGNCPILGSDNLRDWSHRLHQRKARAWTAKSMSLVCPSNWLAQCAAQSSLFGHRHISVIPNPLDLDVFSPGDKIAARSRLGLPKDAPLVLFGANKALQSRVKGFHFLDGALCVNSARKDLQQPHLVLVGADESARAKIKARVPVHFLGFLRQHEMIDAYVAADILVLSSISDNLPNMIAEALACGTPVVAFNVGGVADMVVHLKNGYLARPRDVGDLAEGIATLLELSRQGHSLGETARAKAEELFVPARVARRYIEIYKQAQG
jgi:glycosyltransferase involved in cell wall biosynthesis